MHLQNAMFGAIVTMAGLGIAKPIAMAVSDNSLGERALSPEACRAVDIIVNVLKLYKATPFCSSFLGIQTSTVPAAVTVTQGAQAIVTGTAQQTTISLVGTTTSTLTLLETFYSPTVVATVTVPTISVSTTVVTPPAVTKTTTVYTSPGVAKRSGLPAAELQDREPKDRGTIKLPPFVSAFASEAILSACACLSIPTPLTTATHTLYATSTATSYTTVTDLVVILTTAMTSLTTTVDTTLYQPSTATTSSLSVSVVTNYAPTPTVTTVVSLPYAAQCLNILSGKKLYSSVNHAGNLAYSPINDVFDLGGTFTETSISECCQICQNTIGCAEYNLLDFPTAGYYLCYRYKYYQSTGAGITAQCPNGKSVGYTPGGSPSNAPGDYGLGPCYN